MSVLKKLETRKSIGREFGVTVAAQFAVAQPTKRVRAVGACRVCHYPRAVGHMASEYKTSTGQNALN
ncbi:MAG: hypothetical protein ACI8W7_003406 [Gammaproteobacteria bacterium]|jgi:hypothetical protein